MSPWRHELSAQLRLATPVVVANLAMMSMSVVDAILLGRLSTEAFAAVALGHAYAWAVLIFGIGVLMALDPLVAQAVGARDEPAIGRSMQRGVVLALVLSVPLVLLLAVGAGPAFAWLQELGQPAEIIPDAAAYARTLSLTVVPMLLWVVLRQALQAMGRLRPIVITVIVANLVNAAADYVLIYGTFGAPRLGVVGCALATVVCQAFMVAMLAWASWPIIGPHLWPLRPRVLARAPIARMLRLGSPIGIQLVIELISFNALTVLMGWFGTVQVAGHRAAIVLASLSYMVPLGISTAASVRVGHAVGAGDRLAVHRAAKVSLAMTTVVMAGFALLFTTLPRPLAAIFTEAPDVIALAALLLPLAGAFQLFDGLQVVASGVLRGVGDTRWPMLLNLLGYWGLGLPLGWWWGFRRDAGPEGLWWGLVLGLAFVAVTLLLRVVRRLRHVMERIDLEEAVHTK